jgi:hypothetical protein
MIFGEDTIKTIAEGIYKPADWLYEGIQKVKNLLGLGDDDGGIEEMSDEEKYEQAKKAPGSAANRMDQDEYTEYMKYKKIHQARKKAQGDTPEGTTLRDTQIADAQAAHAEGAKAEEATALPTQAKGESVPKTKAAPGGGTASGKAVASTSGGKLILEVDGFDGVVAQIQEGQTAISEGG